MLTDVGLRYKGDSSSAPESPPGNLHVLELTTNSVDLGWTDHAQGEVAVVVQRCAGSDCSDFTNAIGQAGQDIVTATDRDVQPGMTYRYRVYAVLPTPGGPRGTGTSNVITVTIPRSKPE